MRTVIQGSLVCLGLLSLMGCQKERTEPTSTEKQELEQRQQMINKTMQNRPGGGAFTQPGQGK